MKARILVALSIIAVAGAVAFAQVVTPTTRYKFAWDHNGVGVDHYEVRYTSNGTWTSVGKPNPPSVILPAQAAGAYSAQVRACATATSVACSQAVMAYSVQAPVPPAPTAPSAPTNLRIGLIEVTPPPPATGGTTYFSTNFNGALPAFMTAYLDEGGSCAASADFADTATGATRSWRCQIVDNGAAAVMTTFPRASQVADKPVDPALNRDFYQLYRFVIGAGSSNLRPGPFNDAIQWKLHKSTYGIKGSNTNGWTMISFDLGDDGLMTEPELWSNNLPNSPVYFTGIPYPHFVEGQVYEMVRYYRRDSARGCGYYGLWVNGVQRVHTDCLSFLGTTTGAGGEGLVLQDGAVYAQNIIGTPVIYSLFMEAADVPLGGVKF